MKLLTCAILCVVTASCDEERRYVVLPTDVGEVVKMGQDCSGLDGSMSCGYDRSEDPHGYPPLLMRCVQPEEFTQPLWLPIVADGGASYRRCWPGRCLNGACVGLPAK